MTASPNIDTFSWQFVPGPAGWCGAASPGGTRYSGGLSYLTPQFIVVSFTVVCSVLFCTVLLYKVAQEKIPLVEVTAGQQAGTFSRGASCLAAHPKVRTEQ